MLIVALVLAVVGLAALVTAVVTSNELIAWVCIGASVIGVVLLIVDALRERSRDDDSVDSADGPADQTEVLAEPAEDYPDDSTTQLPTYTEHDTSGASDASEAETSAVTVSDERADDERPNTAT